ncbi:replication-associated protein [Blackfly DNA Virus 10]|nr:replication-associated protein [Blackfly DNA Virus 10]
MPAVRASRSRAWCFTINNYTDDDQERLRTLGLEDTVQYMIWGREVAPETGTKHIQGYIYWHTARTMAPTKERINQRAHLEMAKGTPQQNKEYCSKENDYEEVGQFPAQGKRNDLDAAIETLKTTKSLRQVAEAHAGTFVRYHRGLHAWATTTQVVAPRRERPLVTVVVGLPGVGKSRWIAAESGDDVFYKPNGAWWDGYQQQTNVVLDDFRGGIPFAELLRVLDRYPLKVPIKGGFEEFTSPRIWFSSNKYVCDWYAAEVTTDRLDALYRRLSLYFELIGTGPDQTATFPWKNDVQSGRCPGGPDGLRGHGLMIDY